MKMTKKILAILFSAVLVLGLMAACAKNEATNAAQSNTSGTEAPDTTPFGMIVFSTDIASVNLQFNAEGVVLSVEGNDADGIAMLESAEKDVVGMTCADAVTELTKIAINGGVLTNNLIIKQSVGTEVPSETFMNDMGEAAKKAVSAEGAEANLIVIAAADLDENGYISVASAKQIVMGVMGVEKLDSFDGDDSVDGSGEYLFYITAGDVQTVYTVHGVYGTCHEMSEDELNNQGGAYGDLEDPALMETEPFDNLPTEEATEPATEATEPATEATEPAEATEPTEA